MVLGSIITYAENLAVGAGETKVIHEQHGTTHDAHNQVLLQTSTQPDVVLSVDYFGDVALNGSFSNSATGTDGAVVSLIKAPYKIVVTGGAAPAQVTVRAVVIPFSLQN